MPHVENRLMGTSDIPGSMVDGMPMDGIPDDFPPYLCREMRIRHNGMGGGYESLPQVVHKKRCFPRLCP